MKTNQLLLAVLYLATMLGCASPQTQFKKAGYISLSKKTEASQTTGNITVKLEPFDPIKEYRKSRYKQKFKIVYLSYVTGELARTEVEEPINFFDGMVGFNVTIINNTEHILRMKDARIIYVDPDSNEPVMAFDKQTILSDMESLPVYEILKASLVKKYNPRNDLDPQISKNLKKITKKLKFVNGFNREIMPGMRLQGIVLFNIGPAQMSEGKVSFIDMVSETNSAGIPTKKVRFDYRVKQTSKYYVIVPNVDKNWRKVTKRAYNKLKLQGQSNTGKY